MPVPTITSAATANGNIGTAFSYQITASDSPTSFDSRNLPPQLSLNTATGLISGIAELSGTFVARLFASNASGRSDAFALTITIAPMAEPTGSTLVPVPASYPPRVTIAGGSAGGNVAGDQVFVQQTDVVVGMTSTIIAPSTSAARRVTLTHPGGTNVVFVAVGKAASLNSGTPIYPGGSWTSDPITGQVNGITSSGTETITPFY